jgi:hypothetical protein
MASSTGGKGGKKHGRNKPACAAYRALGTQEANKKIKVARHKRAMAKHEAKRGRVALIRSMSKAARDTAKALKAGKI